MKCLRNSLFFLVLLLPGMAAAQDDEAVYMDEAGASALLYRGRRAYVHTGQYNGTYFWTDPSFKEGDVFYNGKMYHKIPLNIDASRQDLIVGSLSGGVSKVLTREYVERFNIGEQRFLNLRKLYGNQAPEGYWEILYDGKVKIVKQVTRILQQDLDGRLRPEMGYDKGGYRPDVHNIFVYRASYCFITADGQIVPVRRRKQLLNYYKDMKKEIRRHITRLEAGRHLSFEEYCREVVSFAESGTVSK